MGLHLRIFFVANCDFNAPFTVVKQGCTDPPRIGLRANFMGSSYRKFFNNVNNGALPIKAHPIFSFIFLKITPKAFQLYMTYLYRASIGLSYTVGKLSTSTFQMRAHPWSVWVHCALIGEFTFYFIFNLSLKTDHGDLFSTRYATNSTGISIQHGATPQAVVYDGNREYSIGDLRLAMDMWTYLVVVYNTQNSTLKVPVSILLCPTSHLIQIHTSCASGIIYLHFWWSDRSLDSGFNGNKDSSWSVTKAALNKLYVFCHLARTFSAFWQRNKNYGSDKSLADFSE